MLGVLTLCCLTRTAPAQLSFAPAVDYRVGGFAYAIAAADLNNDGFTDLAVVNRTSDTVSILAGNGTGALSPAKDFGAGAWPQNIVSADFNNDGSPDLAVANGRTNTVTMLWNNGQGEFPTSSSLALPAGANSIMATDFNSDSKVDLALGMSRYVPYTSYHPVGLLLGNGAGGFTTGTQIQQFGLDEIAVADFNADGSNDLLVAEEYDGLLQMYPGNGAGDFTTGPASSLPNWGGTISWFAELQVGDMSGDGLPDVFGVWQWCEGPWGVCGGEDQRFMMINNGSGEFAESPAQNVRKQTASDVRFAETTAPKVFTQLQGIADFNLDGMPDLAIAGEAGIEVMLGNGDRQILDAPPNPATYSKFDYLFENTRLVFAGAVELNADHKPDLVWVSDSTLHVRMNEFTCPSGDCSSTFTLALSATPQDGGTVDGSGAYVYGSRVHLGASPNCGWRFDHWANESGETISTSPGYVITVTRNRELVAVFEPDKTNEGQRDLQAQWLNAKLERKHKARPTVHCRLVLQPAGKCRPRTECNVRVYLSNDDQLSTDDALLAQRKLKAGPHARKFSLSATASQGLLDQAATIICVLDPDNTVAETNESNNVSALPVPH
jgi:hypothetical protein